MNLKTCNISPNRHNFLNFIPSVLNSCTFRWSKNCLQNSCNYLWRYTSHFFQCSLAQNMFCWSLFSGQGSNNIWEVNSLWLSFPTRGRRSLDYIDWLILGMRQPCKHMFVGQRYLVWHCVLYLGCIRQVVVVIPFSYVAVSEACFICLKLLLLQKVQRMALDEVVILDADENTIETPFDDVQSLPSEAVSTRSSIMLDV